VNAESIAAFRTSLKKQAGVLENLSFYQTVFYAQSPYVEYVNKTSIVLLVSQSLLYNVSVTIGLSKHLQITPRFMNL
jgi:hypothetical protein